MDKEYIIDRFSGNLLGRRTANHELRTYRFCDYSVKIPVDILIGFYDKECKRLTESLKPTDDVIVNLFKCIDTGTHIGKIRLFYYNDEPDMVTKIDPSVEPEQFHVWSVTGDDPYHPKYVSTNKPFLYELAGSEHINNIKFNASYDYYLMDVRGEKALHALVVMCEKHGVPYEIIDYREDIASWMLSELSKLCVARNFVLSPLFQMCPSSIQVTFEGCCDDIIDFCYFRGISFEVNYNNSVTVTVTRWLEDWLDFINLHGKVPVLVELVVNRGILDEFAMELIDHVSKL